MFWRQFSFSFAFIDLKSFGFRCCCWRKWLLPWKPDLQLNCADNQLCPDFYYPDCDEFACTDINSSDANRANPIPIIKLIEGGNIWASSFVCWVFPEPVFLFFFLSCSVRIWITEWQQRQLLIFELLLLLLLIPPSSYCCCSCHELKN